MYIKEEDPNFWCDRVTKTITKDDLPPDAWEWICKIRAVPIRLIKDVRVGESHKVHTVIPKGFKGYLLEHPEAFNLSENNLRNLNNHLEMFYGLSSELEQIPAMIYKYDDIVFLNDDDYEITPPFFDVGLANYAESIIRERGSDAST